MNLVRELCAYLGYDITSLLVGKRWAKWAHWCARGRLIPSEKEQQTLRDGVQRLRHELGKGVSPKDVRLWAIASEGGFGAPHECPAATREAG